LKIFSKVSVSMEDDNSAFKSQIFKSVYTRIFTSGSSKYIVMGPSPDLVDLRNVIWKKGRRTECFSIWYKIIMTLDILFLHHDMNTNTENDTFLNLFIWISFFLVKV